MHDWNLVALWTAQIVAGDFAAIQALIEAHTGHVPAIAWAPAAASLSTPQLRFLRDYWSTLAEPGKLPNVRQIDPLAMRPALGYVLLVDAVEGGWDFRYRLYGSIVAHVAGLELTGRLMSDHPSFSHATEFALATTRAALQRRQPIYTERTRAAGERMTRWHRLALPLVDNAGAVTRFLVGTVPIGADGRVIGG